MAIAQIIHQLWSQEALPDRYRGFRETWARLNPGWEMRLWSEADIAAMVAADYPQLSALYNGYGETRRRFDLGRALILHRFGGVYADLDTQCLRPIGPLIEGRTLAVGAEPAVHLEGNTGFDRMLCPAFVAAEAGHDFWDALVRRMAGARGQGDDREATGSLPLTRAFHDYAHRDSIRILPSEAVYPFAKADCWSGRVHDLEFWEAATRQAYVAHYWDDGWNGRAIWTGGLPRDVRVGFNDPARPAAGFDHAPPPPKISCLLIARGRSELTARAIEAYLRQTYAERELVVVAAAPDRRLLDHVRALGRPDVKLFRPDALAGVAEQLKLAVSLASGAILCRWDEADLHDPRRLEVQYDILKATDAAACQMRSWTSWKPDEPALGVVHSRALPSSLLALKSAFPNPATEAGEYEDVRLEARFSKVRVALSDLSRLMVHVQGADEPAEAITAPFAPERHAAVLTELANRLPIEAWQRPAPSNTEDAQISVRLFGAFASTSGIATSARGTAMALAASGLHFTIEPIAWTDSHPQPMPAPSPNPLDPALPIWPVNLAHINPGEFAYVVATDPSNLGIRGADRAFTIGIWAWETPNAPAAWRAFHALYDEIWAPSAHAVAAIAREATVPVTVMPHTIELPDPIFDRAALGWPDAAFIFFFAFDALSNFTRKNPDGLIAAYLSAFPTPDASVMLILKGRGLNPGQVARLATLTAGRPDIRIIMEDWSVEQTLGAIAACDCYVSLHRAEGFGRTMAEAMYYGRPVIATAYSGNMDFMSSDTAYLVPYELAVLGAANGDYEAGSIWAEPNLQAAAALMRQVATDSEKARQVGERGQRWVKSHLSGEATGRRIRDRLEHCRQGVAAPRRRQTTPDPEVLILTSVTAAGSPRRYVELLRRLDYDPARLSLAVTETHGAWTEAMTALAADFASVQIFRRDDDSSPADGPGHDRRRAEADARSRNRLVNAALDDQEHVLWLDARVLDYPADLLRRLLAAEREIVAAHGVSADGATRDLSTFRFAPDRGQRDDPGFLVDGLFQPPPGSGRLYLDAFPDDDLVRVDGVGAAALLIRADLHREGLSFPPFSYRGYIGPGGLAMMARDMGYACWAMPRLRVTLA